MADRAAPRQRRVFYGWHMVGALALTEMTSWGVLYYSFSVVLAPMQSELGFSRGALTGAFSLALLVSGLAAIPVGQLLDRHGARLLMTVGSCAAVLLVVLWAQVHSLAALYLVWFGIGAAMAAVLYEPAFAVVATWFVRRRAAALTLLTFGGGLASVVYVPAATWLVERYGWRLALLILALVLAAGTIPLHALVLRRRPSDLGSAPDGEPLPHNDGAAHSLPGVPLRAAIHGRAFRWLTLAFTLTQLGTIAINVHFIPYLTGRGFTPGFAAAATALLGACQIPGRLVFIPLGQRLSQRWLTAGLFGLQCAALLVLLAVPTSWGVLVFAVLFGAGAGASSPARAALVAELYGAAQYGSISGVLALLLTGARVLGPVGAGLFYSATGSYTPVLWTLVLATIGGAAAMAGVRHGRR